ncbi:MAG: Hsp70 family protein [Candidatus Riflebacteria bacterium]|nr:Hsp70 family protein [Candidatus Riflebacteria bacterium]
MERINGIDLGTSNSKAAILASGNPTIIPSAEGVSLGSHAFPGVIAFSKDGPRLIGEPVSHRASTNTDRTILAIERKRGSLFMFQTDGREYLPQP